MHVSLLFFVSAPKCRDVVLGAAMVVVVCIYSHVKTRKLPK